MVKEKYTVDSVVCDYGIFENGELIQQLIFNSSTNAKLVCKIMNLDTNHKIIYEDEQMESKDLDVTVKCTELDNVLEAFKIANNAIYFNDRSDYLGALYDICKAINPNIDVNEIGKKYIEIKGEGEI